MKVEPDLATKWERQADGRTWRFFLRRGVRFHDGTPFDADAVVYTFQRQRQGASAPGSETYFPYVPSYKNIVAIEKEFKVKFDLLDLKPLRNVGEMLDLIARKTP